MKNDKHIKKIINMKNLNRCGWVALDEPLYVEYHDKEWGVPVHDDRILFEFLTLEGAQAGLSWLTILKRREGYRKAFANFDVKKVAKFDKEKIEDLLKDTGIIRNRLKVESTVNNANKFIEIQKEFGSFDKYVWSFVGGKPKKNHWKSLKEIPPATEEAKALSKDLAKRGFKFVGPTIMYAFMQAVGMVDDHLCDCFKRK